MRAHSHGLNSPEFCSLIVPLSEERAQGMPGARCTRGLMCQSAQEWRHTSIQVSGEHTDIPCAMALRLTSCSPRWSELLSPSPPRELLPGSFSPAYAAPGPHDLTVRSGYIRLWTAASIAIPRPTCRDDGDTPLGWARDGISVVPIFRIAKRNIFARRTSQLGSLGIIETNQCDNGASAAHM